MSITERNTAMYRERLPFGFFRRSWLVWGYLVLVAVVAVVLQIVIGG
jgi:hypothetical protein